MTADPIDLQHMHRALQLAAKGQGYVEPNPQVGCVVARREQTLGEGWHREFGGAHAEIEALAAAGDAARGATLYVTLEPCCHQGKTAPCTDAIKRAGVARVVVAQVDPYPEVAGKGVEHLRHAGIQVEIGLCEAAARQLNAPFRKLIERQRPWVIAKWAMTLDGKLASRTGHSRWISSPESRAIVHELRGRVDAVIVGSGTAIRDDPLLTSRPPGPRLAARVVVDSQARLSPETQLAKTARTAPVIIATGQAVDPQRLSDLKAAGCEILKCDGATHLERLTDLCDQLGQRQMTNVLVEGGGRLLGNLLELGEIDEVHAFIAPKLLGGSEAISPIEGLGIDQVTQALALDTPNVRRVAGDIYVSGRVARAKR